MKFIICTNEDELKSMWECLIELNYDPEASWGEFAASREAVNTSLFIAGITSLGCCFICYSVHQFGRALPEFVAQARERGWERITYRKWNQLTTVEAAEWLTRR